MLESKINCPNCNHSWYISSDSAYHKAQIKCDKCGSQFPFIKNIHFSEDAIQPPCKVSSYIHPDDQNALEALKGITGTGLLIKAMMKYSYEKYLRMVHMSDDLKVTTRTCGYINDMVLYSSKRLGVRPPSVYITQNPVVNAYTTGVEDPIIVIHSGLIELLNDDELLGVIAHEMGHIACEHVLYHMLANFIAQFPNLIGLTKLITGSLHLALLEWSRKSELSADRASRIVLGDKKTVIRMLMKLAGGSTKLFNMIDYDDFVSQYEEVTNFEMSYSNKLFKDLATLFRSHPFPIERAHEINNWRGSDSQTGPTVKIQLVIGKTSHAVG